MSWRPLGFKNPYQEIKGTWEYEASTLAYVKRITDTNPTGGFMPSQIVEQGLHDYEAGADAMLEALRKEAMKPSKWEQGQYYRDGIGGKVVFIPDDEEVK